ncbi:Transcriptional activator spt7 [Pichia californica]|uniref:Transcriptional activator spt7 n=1 Tax=Pichia californica TaxID=460514 RepID=A0A9P6WPW6_9ASCO|nr:Transcriptional activator spt7 [[Candida] californica]
MDPLSYQMLQLSSKDSLSQLTTNPSLIQNTYFANSNVNYNRQLKDVSIPNSTTTTTTTTNTNKNQLFTNINSSNENHENWNNNNNSVNNNPINNNNNTYNNYLLQQQKQHQNSFSHPYNSNNIQSHNNNNNYVNYKNINNNNNNNNNTNTNKVTNNLQNSNSQSQNLNFNDHIKIHPQQQQSINNINNNNNNINNNHQQSFSSGTTNNNFIYNSNTSQFNNDNNNNISVNTSDFNKAYNNYDSRVLKSNQSTKLNDTDPSEIDSYKTKLQLKDIIISKLELELEKSKDFQNTILKTQNDSNLNFEIPKNHEELYHKLVEKCHLTEVELEDTKTRLESLITAISMNNSNNLNSTFKNGRYDEEEISHKIITKLKMLTEENDELSRMVSYGKSKEKDIEIALLRKQNNDLLEKVAKLESKINDKK